MVTGSAVHGVCSCPAFACAPYISSNAQAVPAIRIETDANSMDDVQLQRDYYARTAASYDCAHIHGSQETEHEVALGALIGLSAHYGFQSFLDVGCGTGRSVSELRKRLPNARVVGVEPVEALREVAYSKGIPRDVIVEGDATRLTFENGAFDCVSAFAILHHIKNPTLAIREMLRVARKAIFISDLNNFGCGSLPQRMVSQTLNALGLWKAFQFLATRGKGYKYSEGDGIHYSYSVYNDYRWLAQCCRTVHVLNTKGAGVNPYRTCSHVALLAIKHPADASSVDASTGPKVGGNELAL